MVGNETDNVGKRKMGRKRGSIDLTSRAAWLLELLSHEPTPLAEIAAACNDAEADWDRHGMTWARRPRPGLRAPGWDSKLVMLTVYVLERLGVEVVRCYRQGRRRKGQKAVTAIGTTKDGLRRARALLKEAVLRRAAEHGETAGWAELTVIDRAARGGVDERAA